MTKRVLTRHMQDIMANISDLTLEQAYNYLDKAQSAASIDKQLLGSNVVSSQIEETSGLERYFFDQLTINPHLSGIYVGGLNGNFFMVSRHDKFEPGGFRTKIIRHDKGVRSTKLLWRDSNYLLYHYEDDPADTYDPRTRTWFKMVMEHRHIIWTDPYIFYTAQKPGVTIAGPVLDQGGAIRAIVGVDIGIAELSTFVNRLRVGKSGRAFILHQNGDVIAFHDMDKLIISGEKEDSLRLPKVSELGNSITEKSFDSMKWDRDDQGNLVLAEAKIGKFEHEGKEYLSMYSPFPEPDLPWIIGVYLPEDDYLAEIKTNQLVNTISTIFVTLLATLLGLFLAKKIVAPVVTLADGARKVEKFGSDEPFQLQTIFKELQETADSFARMKVALSDYEKKLRENEKIYRAITDNANEAIIMLDSNHEIVFSNPAAEKMFGYTASEMKSMMLPQLIAHDPTVAMYQEGIAKFMNDDTGTFHDKSIMVVTLNRDGEEIPVELSISKVMMDNALHAVAIARNISERIKAAQLRKALVNDLHDGIGGNLTNIKLLAEMSLLQDMPAQTTKILNAIASISKECMNEIRNYMNILDETELAWKSFTAELHQYCARTLELHNIELDMSTDLYEKAPPPTSLLYMNVFRIIKEALNNVIKHSDCDRVTVKLLIAEKHLQMSIGDNGSVSEKPRRVGKGLLSMLTRTRELGGVLKISWDKGARIALNIPFTRITVQERTFRDASVNGQGIDF